MKAMAPHCSTLAWKIPGMEEPGRLQSMGSLKVGHDWVTLLWLFTFVQWRRKGNLLQYSCLESPGDGGAWWAAVYGVAQGWTRLKQLSSSISMKLSLISPTKEILLSSQYQYLYLSWFFFVFLLAINYSITLLSVCKIFTGNFYGMPDNTIYNII